MLFTTGFAANLGVLTTFAGPDMLVCSDELNHASLIDGRRLAGAPLAVYRHLDAAHVDELLRADTRARAIVVSETTFSMDGDVAPVDKLLDVCAHHGALLVLDEAHAVLGPAVRGAAGRRPCCASARSRRRSAPSAGSWPDRARYTDLLVNRARAYIFTTASSPADAAAALAAVRVLRSPEGDELRARLRANVDRLRPGHPSPVVPYVCGSEARTRSRRPTRCRHAASSSPPSGRRRCRRGPRACGSRSRPTTPPTRSTASPPRWPSCSPTARELAPTAHAGVRGRDRHRRGQDVVGRGAGARAPRRGVHVAARKPVQSGEPGDDHRRRRARRRHRRGTRTVCPPRARCSVPWAPPMAAAELGLPPFTTADLAGGIVWPASVARRPGRRRRRPALPDQRRRRQRRPRAPVAPDVVVLVADAGLGTINAVRLSVGAFADFPVIVALNRFDGRRSAARPQPRAPHRASTASTW